MPHVWGIAIWGWGISTPYVTNQDPAASASDVDKDRSVKFRFTDDFNQVVLSSVVVWVRGTQVFVGGTFSSGWSRSSYEAVGQGFDFKLIPQDALRWQAGEEVYVRARGVNVSNCWGDETWRFTAEDHPFTFRIYDFVFDGVRIADESKD